jgi:hypothetical protein
MIPIKDVIQVQRLVAKVARRKNGPSMCLAVHHYDNGASWVSIMRLSEGIADHVGSASNATEMQWLIDKLRELLRP